MADSQNTFLDRLIVFLKNNKLVAILMLMALVVNGLVQLLNNTTELNEKYIKQKTERDIMRSINLGKNIDYVIGRLGKPSVVKKNSKTEKRMTWDLGDIVIIALIKDDEIVEIEYNLPPWSKSIFDIYTIQGFIHPINDIDINPLGKLQYSDIVNISEDCVFWGSPRREGAVIQIKLPPYLIRAYEQEEEYIIQTLILYEFDDIFVNRFYSIKIRYSKDKAFGIVDGDEEEGWTLLGNDINEVKKFILY